MNGSHAKKKRKNVGKEIHLCVSESFSGAFKDL